MSTNGAGRPLPGGWRWARVRQVCDAVRGVTFPRGEAARQSADDRIACLTTSGVQAEPNWDSCSFIPRYRLPGEHLLVRPGDVLVSTANSKALVGKSCLVDQLPFECTFGAFVTVLRPRAGMSPEFVALSLRSSRALGYFYNMSSNTTNISNLRVRDLLDFPIPLPPFGEQRRIAAQLSEQMALVERARRAAQAHVEAARALPAAFVRQVFDCEEAKEWPRARLASVCRIISGGTPPRDQARYWNGEIPWASPKDIKVFDLVDTEEHITQTGLSETSATSLVPADSVLVVVRGMILARDFPVAVARVPLTVNQDIRALIPSPDVLHSDYLAYALMADKARLLALVASSAHGTMRLDARSLLDFTFACPATVDSQRRVATQIAGTLGTARRARDAAEAQLEAVIALRGALLEEVFGGFEPPP